MSPKQDCFGLGCCLLITPCDAKEGICDFKSPYRIQCSKLWVLKAASERVRVCFFRWWQKFGGTGNRCQDDAPKVENNTAFDPFCCGGRPAGRRLRHPLMWRIALPWSCPWHCLALPILETCIARRLGDLAASTRLNSITIDSVCRNRKMAFCACSRKQGRAWFFFFKPFRYVCVMCV